jgi:xanthine phosphoribosyltransferase
MSFKFFATLFLFISSSLFCTAQEQTPSIKRFITWDQFHQHTIALSNQLKKQGQWSGIIAITRGGLVPAAILAQELNIKLIDTLCISSYDDNAKAKTENFKILKNAQEQPGKWLIVDDLVDSGDTSKVAKNYSQPRPLLACMQNQMGNVLLMYFSKK